MRRSRRTAVQQKQTPASVLLEGLAERRTRRFPKGAAMPKGGPLAFASHDDKTPRATAPLTKGEQAKLAFAGVGLTGPVLGDVPYQRGPEGGGNVLTSLVGRTALSPDAAHCVSLIVISDRAPDETADAYFLRRPQNFKREKLEGIAKLSARRGPNWEVEMYGALRVPLQPTRAQMLRKIEAHKPPMPTFNKWASNAPGSTYFLPVLELSEIYLSILFGGLEKSSGYFIVDDRNGLLPSGLASEARSQGGYLHDKLADRRIFTQDYIETLASMLASIELGAVMQNLSLMAHTLGLGGWPHFAGGTAWLEALRFKGTTLKSSQVLGLPATVALQMQLAGQDQDVWSPLGLLNPQYPEVYADALIKPYCPPFYPSMKDAVHAFVEAKFERERGRFRVAGNPSRWKEDATIKNGIEGYTPEQIQAAIDHCSYVYDRYGRFPGKFGPLTTVTAFQVHHLEGAFYRKYYDDSVLKAVSPATETA